MIEWVNEWVNSTNSRWTRTWTWTWTWTLASKSIHWTISISVIWIFKSYDFLATHLHIFKWFFHVSVGNIIVFGPKFNFFADVCVFLIDYFWQYLFNLSTITHHARTFLHRTVVHKRQVTMTGSSCTLIHLKSIMFLMNEGGNPNVSCWTSRMHGKKNPSRFTTHVII